MRKRIGILVLTLTLSLLLLNSFSHGQLTNHLRVSFIDVGQGCSAWLRASDGTDILWYWVVRSYQGGERG
ncbi:MAG: hypothetical protein ACOC6F_01125 [bacterium]